MKNGNKIQATVETVETVETVINDLKTKMTADDQIKESLKLLSVEVTDGDVVLSVLRNENLYEINVNSKKWDRDTKKWVADDEAKNKAKKTIKETLNVDYDKLVIDGVDAVELPKTVDVYFDEDQQKASIYPIFKAIAKKFDESDLGFTIDCKIVGAYDSTRAIVYYVTPIKEPSINNIYALNWKYAKWADGQWFKMPAKEINTYERVKKTFDIDIDFEKKEMLQELIGRDVKVIVKKMNASIFGQMVIEKTK